MSPRSSKRTQPSSESNDPNIPNESRNEELDDYDTHSSPPPTSAQIVAPPSSTRSQVFSGVNPSMQAPYNTTSGTSDWDYHTANRRQEVRQLVNSNESPRPAPRTNTRIQASPASIQQQVPLASDPKSNFRLYVLLAYTCPTPRMKGAFNVELPHRENVQKNAWKQIPIIPFINHPPNAISGHRIQNTQQIDNIPNGMHRWVIPPALSDLNKPETFADFVHQFITALHQHLVACQAPDDMINEILTDKIYPVYRVLNRKQNLWVFDLPWDTEFPPLEGMNFTFTHHDRTFNIAWYKQGPMIWPFSTLITLNTPAHIPVELVQSGIEKLPNVVLLDIWQVWSTPKVNPTQSHWYNRFTGKWLIAVGLLNEDLSAGTQFPVYARKSLPGWLYLNGTPYQLHYEDRRNHCFNCKDPLDFHDQDHCRFYQCGHCGMHGQHKPSKCPTNRTKATQFKDQEPIKQTLALPRSHS